MKTTSKMKTPLKTKTSSKEESYLNFFWWPLTSTAMRQMILNQKCYQVSKPEMELHMIDIIYMVFWVGRESRVQNVPEWFHFFRSRVLRWPSILMTRKYFVSRIITSRWWTVHKYFSLLKVEIYLKTLRNLHEFNNYNDVY